MKYSIPVIELKDLILRPLTLEDLDAYNDYRNDKDIMEQFHFTNLNKEDCYKRLEQIVNNYKERVIFIWAIELKSENKMIGILTFYPYSIENKWIEITFGITKKYRGKGYATTATRAIIDYIFNKTDFNRIQICHSEINAASKRVIEKLGFVYEGTLRQSHFRDNHFYDRNIYSLIKDDYTNM